MITTYNAFIVSEENGMFKRNISQQRIDGLPEHDTLIKVKFSSLNYKDALSISGHKGITKQFPHQPGIDAAGLIEHSSNPDFQKGDEVIVTGYDLGMNTAGGFGEYIRVPSEWVIKLPEELTLKESMIYGTAGFTAALGLYLLERNGQQPNQGPIVVTGATGGVGSLAVSLLNKTGYQVIASTGKHNTHADFLYKLGASQVVDREFVDIDSKKLLLREKWAGAIDTVGGTTLESLLKACKPYGNIACCGLVQSAELNTSVYPFIINGVSLLGIATAENPIEIKREIWQKLATKWSVLHAFASVKEIDLEQLSPAVDDMLKGNHTGRTVVAHS